MPDKFLGVDLEDGLQRKAILIIKIEDDIQEVSGMGYFDCFILDCQDFVGVALAEIALDELLEQEQLGIQ